MLLQYLEVHHMDSFPKVALVEPPNLHHQRIFLHRTRRWSIEFFIPEDSKSQFGATRWQFQSICKNSDIYPKKMNIIKWDMSVWKMRSFKKSINFDYIHRYERGFVQLGWFFILMIKLDQEFRKRQKGPQKWEEKKYMTFNTTKRLTKLSVEPAYSSDHPSPVAWYL